MQFNYFLLEDAPSTLNAQKNEGTLTTVTVTSIVVGAVIFIVILEVVIRIVR